MPTWDEITPSTERDLRKKWNAVNVLIGINVAGLLLPALLQFARVHALHDLAPFTWESGIKRGWIWQFFTYTFWHPTVGAGNSADIVWVLLGFAFGCYILHTFGRELERDQGWRRFSVFYLATGAYGAVVHAVYQVIVSSSVPAMDFLGPTLSILLACALRTPDRQVLFFFFPMRLLTLAFVLIGVVLLFTLAGFHTGMTPVATLGSVGAAYAMVRLEPMIDAWMNRQQARRERHRFVEVVEVRREVDRILAKISSEGMGALSSHEKKLLKRASEVLNSNQDGRG